MNTIGRINGKSGKSKKYFHQKHIYRIAPLCKHSTSAMVDMLEIEGAGNVDGKGARTIGCNV